jgi:glycosyltransferase involved in cell wall biosynthesis
MEMAKKSILYIGNNLTKKTNYATSMDTLSKLLVDDEYKIYKSSNKTNKIIRLLDICFSVIRLRKVDFILIDTFSTSNFYYVLCASQLARLFRVKYIPILRGGNLPHRLDKSKRMSNMIFKNSHKNVAPSNYLKTEFESRGFESMFIPNILEVDRYSYIKREKLKPSILWVRAFKHLYNPIMAIKVLDILKKEYNTAELCMIGPHSDDSIIEVESLIRKYKLEDSVKITGVLAKDEWLEISKKYDIFINTTNFDNTPISVMEAMALGLTIVSTNAGGMPFLIDDKVDGVLVDKNDNENMAKVIINLIKANNQVLSKNARKKAENFGWNVVKTQWNSLLNN